MAMSKIPHKCPELLSQIDDDIERFVADGIYDQEPVRTALEDSFARRPRDHSAEEKCGVKLARRRPRQRNEMSIWRRSS